MTFSWTHNEPSINGQSTAGDTSTLTISSVQYNDAGTYVCTLRSGLVSVKSNTATVTVYGMYISPHIIRSYDHLLSRI